MNSNFPPWLENLANQLGQGQRIPPPTPDYSQMHTREPYPGDFEHFINSASGPPGVTLNRSGGAHFNWDYNRGPMVGQGPPTSPPKQGFHGFDYNRQQAFPSFEDQLKGQKPWTAADDARVYPMEPGAGYQNTSGPGYARTWPGWALRNMVGMLRSDLSPIVRTGLRAGGGIGALANMVTPSDELAPASADQAPQWSWPGGSYSP